MKSITIRTSFKHFGLAPERLGLSPGAGTLLGTSLLGSAISVPVYRGGKAPP